MKIKRSRISVTIAVLVLVGITCLVGISCRSGDPTDQMLDQLEQAISRLESAVSTARAQSAQGLGADIQRELADTGGQVQKSYAEYKARGNDGLSTDQLKRGTALNERAVLAVGDMLNVRLNNEKK